MSKCLWKSLIYVFIIGSVHSHKHLIEEAHEKMMCVVSVKVRFDSRNTATSLSSVNTLMSLASFVHSVVSNTSVRVDASKVFFAPLARFCRNLGLSLFRDMLDMFRRFQATLLLKHVFENLGFPCLAVVQIKYVCTNREPVQALSF